MALIDVRCLTCEVVAEVYRAAVDHPLTPPCPHCGAATEQIHLPRSVRVLPPAVVVYKAPDGTFRFPGTDDPKSRTAQQYATLGYERIEARGFAEVRRLEGQVSKQQAGEIRQRVERQCQFREESLSFRRAQIRHVIEQGAMIPEHDERGRPTGRMKLVKLGPEARDLLQAASEKNYRKPGPQAREVGFHVDVYANNRSNRDEARRADGKRMRD